MSFTTLFWFAAALIPAGDTPQQAVERAARIRAELREPSQPDWTGRYERRGGRLSISAYSGGIYTWSSCMGPVDETLSLAVDDRRMDVTWQQNSRRRAESWWSVPWCERRYLVPESRLPDFCAEVNAGIEPRWTLDGTEFLHGGHEDYPAMGFPEVPEPYRELLLREPLVTTIAAIERVPIEGDPLRDRETRFTLPIGERAGVRRDMRFFLGPGSRWIGWVVRVHPETCTVLTDELCERGVARLRVGDLAYTREPPK